MTSRKTSAIALAALIAGGLFATADAQEMKKLAIGTIVEVPSLNQLKDGMLAYLATKGYVQGKTLQVDYQNANGNMGTLQQIAKKFAGDKPDVIVAITTPATHAMIAAAPGIPVIFAPITDPIKAKLLERYKKPGGMLTGLTDASPIHAQMDLYIKIAQSKKKKIGIIYNPGHDGGATSAGWVRDDLKARGIELVESLAPTTNEIIPAARKLAGNVDFIFIPNDSTIVGSMEAIVKVGRDTQTPVFAAETFAVRRGAVAGLGYDYTQLGQIAGDMVLKVFQGTPVGDIDAVIGYEATDKWILAVNPEAAKAMGATIPDDVMAAATDIIK